MLAKLLRPDAADHDPLVDHVGLVLIDHAVKTGLAPASEVPLNLATIRRSIGNAYDLWWLSLPWWKTLWFSGSIERRHRKFTDHAAQCGLLDNWVKRAIIGIGVVRMEHGTGRMDRRS